MTISNNGYEQGFSTDPSYFTLTAGNVGMHPPPTFSYDANATSALDEWQTINVLSGGTYSGTLVFQLSEVEGAFYGYWGYGWYMNYQSNSFMNYQTNFTIFWVPPIYKYWS
jgi:hypothetical protein